MERSESKREKNGKEEKKRRIESRDSELKGRKKGERRRVYVRNDCAARVLALVDDNVLHERDDLVALGAVAARVAPRRAAGDGQALNNALTSDCIDVSPAHIVAASQGTHLLANGHVLVGLRVELGQLDVDGVKRVARAVEAVDRARGHGDGVVAASEGLPVHLWEIGGGGMCV